VAGGRLATNFHAGACPKCSSQTLHVPPPSNADYLVANTPLALEG
jgi:hypothetical protein